LTQFFIFVKKTKVKTVTSVFSKQGLVRFAKLTDCDKNSYSSIELSTVKSKARGLAQHGGLPGGEE
jgi:hypothetical protein